MVMSLSGSQLRVYENIPFNSDYQHVRYFTSREQQESWMGSRSMVYTARDFNFLKHNGRIGIKVPMNIEQLRNVTYIRYINQSYGLKSYYCFVDDIEALNVGSTMLYTTLDVFQTYRFDFQLKPSYVLREHRNEWYDSVRPNQFNLPEGLDYGKEYRTRHIQKITPFNQPVKFLVVATKDPLAENSVNPLPYVGGTPQALNFYFVPFYYNGTTLKTLNVISKSGNEFNVQNPTYLMNFLFNESSVVDYVVSMYVSDYIGINFNVDFDGGRIVQTTNSNVELTSLSVDGYAYAMRIQNAPEFDVKETTVNNIYQSFGVGNRGRLLNSPYSVLTLDDFKGNRIDLNPAWLNANQLTLVWRGTLSTDNKVTVSVKGYNTQITNPDSQTESSQEIQVANINPQNLPIKADALSAYLQGNRNSIQTRLSQNKFNTFNNLFSAGMGMVGSMAVGNPLGATGALQQGVTGAMNGFYNIKSQNAQLNDISNLPPSVQYAGSDSYYDYGYGNYGINLIWKTAQLEYLNVLTDFFHMYGYKTNRLKTPSIRSRQHFNYVQTENVSLFGEIPNTHLLKLREIFNNGVTLWHVDDIGNYSLENGVR